jgi:hypothetical protein
VLAGAFLSKERHHEPEFAHIVALKGAVAVAELIEQQVNSAG